MQKGEVILVIPPDGDSIININDLPGSPIFDLWNSCNMANFADKDDETMVQQMFLALFFIWHRRQGEASRFKVYLDSLPGQTHLITQWTRAVRCSSFTIEALTNCSTGDARGKLHVILHLCEAVAPAVDFSLTSRRSLRGGAATPRVQLQLHHVEA